MEVPTEAIDTVMEISQEVIPTPPAPLQETPPDPNITMEVTPTDEVKIIEDQQPAVVDLSGPEAIAVPEEKSNVEISISPEKTILSKELIPEKHEDEDLDGSKMDESFGDSQVKEQKSLSREMQSLIKSAKDSKIISEFTQITSKMRKTRKELDSSAGNVSINTSLDADKSIGSRRSSDNSLVSSSSDVSDVTGRRSMRSQNPDFLHKQRKFLNSLSGKPNKESSEGRQTSISESDSEDTHIPQDNSVDKLSIKDSKAESPKRKNPSDKYCWRCHWLIEPSSTSAQIPHCSVCPRSFHPKCLGGKAGNPDRPGWACPECITILNAEAADTRSPAMQKTSLNSLCTLLNYALARMKLVVGVEEFLQPVDEQQCPDYREHVVHPMDLGRVQRNILDGLYGSTEGFLADTLWILHNCLVYNSPVRSRLTVAARALVRECRKELGEIEACPECYAAAHARRPTWFTDVCSTPHVLLWAKLKGFPFWPAKGMTVNEVGMVDVRFFGDHDRAWVPVRYCFLYATRDPNNTRSQRNDIAESIKEAEQHIKNIIRKFGSFVHAPPRTPFEPARLGEQLKEMIPGYQGVLPAPRILKVNSNTSSPANKIKRSRSSSKGSKDFIDGYGSEGDEVDVVNVDNSFVNNIRRKSVDLDSSLNSSAQKINKKRTAEEDLSNSSSKLKRTSSSDMATNKEVHNEKKRSMEVDIEITTNESAKDSSNDTIFKSDKSECLASERIDKNSDKTHTTEEINNIELKDNKDQHTSEKNLKYKTSVKPTSNNQHSAVECANTIADEDEKTSSIENNSASSENKSTSVNNKTVSLQNRILSTENKSSSIEKKISLMERKSSLIEKKNIKSPEKISSRKDQMPTITSIRSLAAEESTKVHTKNTYEKKDVSATDNKSSNTKKSQKLPSPIKNSEKNSKSSNNNPTNVSTFVNVEIKPEPIDVDELQKSTEKNDLLGSLNLRPTTSVESPPLKVSDLRNIRRVVTMNSTTPARARKTFPQPSPIPDENRPELNGKNTMVYIPIQPPTTSAPAGRVTTVRPNRTSVCTLTTQRTVTTNVISGMNQSTSTPLTMSPTLPMVTISSNLMPTPPSSTLSPNAVLSDTTTGSLIPTVPVLSTLNGQWAFCLPPQIVNIDGSIAPMVNGIGEAGAVQAAPAPAAAVETSSAVRPPIITPVPTSALIAPAPTPTLQASAREPPPLLPRPGHPLDPTTPIGALPVPSDAGPCSQQINQSAVKLADFFRSLLTESLQVLQDPEATVASLNLQIEQLKWKHKQELNELKHNTDMQILEIRNAIEREKAAVVTEARRVAEIELNAAVNHAKSKTWCANCRQEAQFYCCWNTSYCDYPCQQAHWTQHHFSVCTQKRNQSNLDLSSNSEEDSLMMQAGSTSVPRPSAVRPTTIITTSSAPSLVNVNMQAGSAYKRQNFNQPAYLINKQLLNAEETTAKVTPGGYLIVGGSNTGRPLVSHMSPHSAL